MKNVRLNAADKKVKANGRFRWIMKASWNKLSRGEKVARVVLKTAKYAAIVAAVVAIGSIIIGAVIGILVAIGIVGAVAGGFENASRTNTGRFYGHYKW